MRNLADSASKAQGDVAALQQQLAGVSDELNRVRQSLETVQTAKAQVEQRLAAATAKPSRDDGELLRLQSLLAQTQGDLVASRRETEEIRVQLQAAQGNLAVASNQHAKATTEAVAKLRQAEDYATKLEAANQSLTNQVDTLKSKLAAADSAQPAVAMPDNAGEIAALREELERTKRELAANQRTADDARNQVKLANSRLADLSNQSAKALNDALVKAHGAESYARNLEESNRALAAQVEDLRKQVALAAADRADRDAS